MILGALLGPLLSFLTNVSLYTQAFGNQDILGIVQCVLYLVISAAVGAAGGYILLAAAAVGYVLLKALVGMPSLIRYFRVKKNLPIFMRSFEPNFSIDLFIGKLIYLTSMMVYSDRYDNLSVYDGEPMKNTFEDIIDLRWRGVFDVKKYYVENGLVYLDVVMYMDDIHCRRRRVFRSTLRTITASPSTRYPAGTAAPVLTLQSSSIVRTVQASISMRNTIG